MFYPTKAHIRQITGLAVAVTLVGTLGYVVTHTAALERRSAAAARTQDIVLDRRPPLPAPVEAPKGMYMGRISGRAAAGGAVHVDSDDVATVAAYAAAPASASAVTTTSGRAANVTWGSSAQPGQTRSASGGGYANPGMSGVGAWGGVSGVVRPDAAAATAPKGPKALKEAKTTNGRKSRGSSGGGATSGDGATATLTEFSTGAAAVQGTAGVVAAANGQVASASPASSPAATPEPMSFLLMAAGLAGIYKARRYVQ